MTVVYKWAEAVRCPHCALVGIASLAGDVEKTEAKIDRLPEGFKIVSTKGGDNDGPVLPPTPRPCRKQN